jgi:hypothetical protein
MKQKKSLFVVKTTPMTTIATAPSRDTAAKQLDAFFNDLNTATQTVLQKNCKNNFSKLQAIFRRHDIQVKTPDEALQEIIRILEIVRQGNMIQGGDLDSWGEDLMQNDILSTPGWVKWSSSLHRNQNVSLGTLAFYIYALDKPDVRLGTLGKWLSELGRSNASLIETMLNQLSVRYKGKLRDASERAKESCRGTYYGTDCAKRINQICQLIPYDVAFEGEKATELRNLLHALCKFRKQ